MGEILKFTKKNPQKIQLGPNIKLNSHQDAKLIQADKKREKEKQDIHNTTFERIKKEHALRDLEKSNEKYLKSSEEESNIFEDLYAWGDEKLTRYLTENDKLDGVLNTDSKASLLRKQNNFIEKILGTNEGFNDEYIKGFNSEKGNFITKISNFEKKINNNNDNDNDNEKISPLELANYISYLEKKGYTYKIYKLKEKINNIKYNTRESNSKTNQEENEKAVGFLNNIWSTISNKFEEIKENINNIFNKISNFNEFNKEFINLDEIGRDEMIIQLENNRQKFINKIINNLPKNSLEKEKIATDFVNNIIKKKNNPKQILFIIAEFKKQNDSSLNSKQLIEESGKIINNNNRTNIAIATKEGKSKSVIEKIIKDAKKQEFTSKKLNTLNNEQIESITNRLQNGESFDNIIQEIAQDNEELRDILYEEKENNKKSNTKVKSDENEHEGEEKEEHSNYTIDEDEFIAGEKAGTYDLSFYDIKSGYINIKGLTKKEKLNTIGNPEGLKNLINFYQFFKDLNLEGVWKYRQKLALSMGNVNINLNDNDSISEAELFKFGKELIKVINSVSEENPKIPYKSGFKIPENIGNLSGVKSALRIYSGAGSPMNNEATYNRYGEDKFTSQLRKLGIIGGAYFHTMQLRKLMK